MILLRYCSGGDVYCRSLVVCTALVGIILSGNKGVFLNIMLLLKNVLLLLKNVLLLLKSVQFLKISIQFN